MLVHQKIIWQIVNLQMEEELLLLLYVKWHDAFNCSHSRIRHLRDHTDPFNLSNKVFITHFLLPKPICRSFIEDLMPHDKQGTCLPFALRFLATLNFYATGSFQKRVGGNVLGLSQSTVSRSLASITKLLVTQKASEICFPQTVEEQLEVKEGYKAKCDIDNVIGAIGTTHINILTPTEKRGSSKYLNKQGECSIIVEGICDHRLLFTSLNAKSPGSHGNLLIWQNTPARSFLMSNHKKSSQNAWLLGDATYPLEPWLLTPVTKAMNGQEKAYNKKHKIAHNSIKLAFGLLRTRFKCLSKKRKLYYIHERAANIIYACVILHNILLKHGGERPLDKNELETPVEEAISRGSSVTLMPWCVDGAHVRDGYVQSL